MLRCSIALLCFFAAPLWAEDTEDFSLPPPSDTTETCTAGLIWDIETQSCMAPEDSTNDDAALIQDARSLAYAGRYADAQAVLELLDPADPWVLTYNGFLARKTGQSEVALAYYEAALQIDPDNLLTRSYMGQGFAAQGDYDAARAQLAEIRRLGGQSTWPEIALRLSISGDYTY